MEAVTLLIGVSILLYGIFNLFLTKKYVKHSSVVQGKIIELSKEPVSRTTAYFPVIEYYDEFEQQKKVFKSMMGYDKHRFEVGDLVEVRSYMKKNKQELLINNWSAIWGKGVFSVVFGAFWFLIGTIQLFQ
ncbi:DUF3592 domain-containing protein [Bacillus sp. AK128]